MNMYCPPVKVTANNRFTRWSNDVEDLDMSVYNIVLGVSVANLEWDSIESISFSYGTGYLEDSGPLEVLKNLPKTSSGILRLALHRQFSKFSKKWRTLVVDMEIRTSTNKSSRLGTGSIELHYMELHTYKPNPGGDIPLNFHKPFYWSINVAHADESKNNIDLARSARIMHYSISGNGAYVATISVLGKWLQLDLWDLESESGASTNLASGSQSNKPSPPYYPRASAQARIPITNAFHIQWTIFMVSLSWNASTIAVTSENPDYLRGLRVYSVTQESQAPSGMQKAPHQTSALDHLEVEQQFPQFKDFIGLGRFHITSTKSPDASNELFISCDGVSVEIYSIYGKWNHVRSIKLISSHSMTENRRLIDGIRGKYCAWTDCYEGDIEIWNLESGSIVSRMALTRGSDVRFSSDGSIIAVRQAGGLTTVRWTESGTIIASAKGNTGSYPAFIYNDSQIFIPSITPDETYGRGKLALISDTTSLQAIHRLSIPTANHEQQMLQAGTDIQMMYSLHGSKLDLVCLQDFIIPPYPQSRYSCNDVCYDESSTCRVSILHASTPASECDFTMPSGLTYKVQFLPVSSTYWRVGTDSLHSVKVSVSSDKGELRNLITIPAAQLGSIAGSWLAYKVSFIASRNEMVLYTDYFVMVWRLPTVSDDQISLLLIWWVQPGPYQVRGGQDCNWATLAECQHGDSYLKMCFMDGYDEVVKNVIHLRCEIAFSYESSAPFLDGLLVLIEMFNAEDGSDTFQQSVLDYTGRYLNNYSNPDDLSESVLAKICRSVTQENHAQYAEFLHSLMNSPYGNWIPRQDFKENTNPIWILLNMTKKVPRAIDLVQILIEYCIRRARDEKDWYMVSPVLQPLHSLVSQQHLYPEIVHGCLKNLAFIPVKDRAFIMDYHVIAHPPEFRRLCWWLDPRALHECKDPMLQLDRFPAPKEHDLLTDNFTRDVYVASFDLLWKTGESTVSNGIHSWISTLLHVIWFNCKIFGRTTVECHDFSLESLDNPAIAALVEYKWSIPRSINQLYNISNGEEDGSIYVLSFSVLFVFIHMLFELRVSKTVCHFVTIIVRIMSEIRVFFVVFATGVIAFTIAILHLLHACPVGLCTRETNFPSHFYGAISSTYFFMGGRYDPVEQEFEGENWPFHTMMIIYFFFTAILLLNVLIALINVAFTAGDETWRLVWIENRLSYVASAENMSHHIPGFRAAHNWFPKEIYYSATIQQMNKYFESDSEKADASHKLFGQSSSAKSAVGISSTAKATAADQKRAQRHQEELRKQQEKLIEGLRKELKHSQTQISTLQTQFREQQKVLEGQIKELKAANKADFKDMKDFLLATMTTRSSSSAVQ
ncbi:hypothetical protein BGZ50_008677 [Haplosporangium sp. Z 11]|nr:hypothetical protein BGZ50_008677 [Haplosporangium sp. Z 11]